MLAHILARTNCWWQNEQQYFWSFFAKLNTECRLQWCKIFETQR